MSDPSRAASHPSFREALRFWFKLGLISFGGPTGQIAILHTELVQKKRWIGENRFLHALNYCMLLPGPEATQLATYCGWLLHGTRGGIAAGVLFVLPAAILLWVLSLVYVTYGQLPWIAAIFYGLKPAVSAIVVAAMIRLGRRALKTPAMWGLAALSFAAIFFAHVPFPAIILGAAVLGYFGGKYAPQAFPSKSKDENASEQTVISDFDRAKTAVRPSLLRAVKVLGISLVLWWAPVLAAGVWQGWSGTLAREGIFFSKAATITFGGAYAVLPYVSQQAIERFTWLNPAQMLDGLGLAETTPGPLIMVVQFVGFLGGWNHPDGLSPLVAATLGAALTTWTTFVPCFLWIFLGAPHIEQLHENVSLNRVLSTVTAAVVGVVLNLAVWFALRVFFPSWTFGNAANDGTTFQALFHHLDFFALSVSVAAFIALHRFKIDMLVVIFASALVGLLRLYLPAS